MSGWDRISMKLYYLHYGRKNFNAILSVQITKSNLAQMVDIVLVFMLALVMHQPESDGSGSRRISPRSLLTPRRDRRRTTVAQHSGMQGSDPRGGPGPMVGANPSPMVAVCPPPPPPPPLQQAHPGHYQQQHPHQQQVS